MGIQEMHAAGTQAKDALTKQLDQRLRQNIETLPNWRWIIDDVFVQFQPEGTKPPLFWCFNNWVEAIALARVLGPDQPLVAMHSLQKVCHTFEEKNAYFQTAVSIYRDGILQRVGDENFVLGGNCQGAGIMEVIAQDVLAAKHKAHPLILLEHSPRFSYPGRTQILFGSQSKHFNPFLQGKNRVPSWDARFPNYAHHEVRGDHGQYFRSPGLDDLATVIDTTVGSHLANPRDSLAQ